jgi:transposase
MSAGKPRDVWKERQWRRWLRAWQRSGLSVSAFCRQQGLALGRFYAWRRIVARRDGQATTLVPVQVLTEPGATAASALEVILTSGRRLRVPCGFDAATLRQVLAVLEEDPAC